MRATIIGGGGHAKVAIDIFRQHYSESDLIGIIDDADVMQGGNLLGIPVIGKRNRLSELRETVDHVFIAIGNNKVRSNIVCEMRELNFKYLTLVHPKAIVAESARIGDGTLIAAGAIIQPKATIQCHVIVNTGATVDHDCTIESFAHVCPGVHLAGEVTIGKGTQVGIGTVVIQCRHIGDWSFIGAGSIVVDNIGSFYKAYGTPCKVKGKL